MRLKYNDDNSNIKALYNGSYNKFERDSEETLATYLNLWPLDTKHLQLICDTFNWTFRCSEKLEIISLFFNLFI